MKRASYREGVEYIALNDEPTEMDPEAVAIMPSACLLSAIFAVSADRVARDVVRYRTNLERQERRDARLKEIHS